MSLHRVVPVLLFTAALARAADDLPNPFRDVPAERNGWGLLVEACGLVKSSEFHDLCPPGGGYPDPWQPTRPAILHHLEINAPALAKLDEALAKPELVHPPSMLLEHGEGRAYGQFAKWREIARLKSQRALTRSAQGDVAGALRDIDDLLTFVDRLDDSGGTLIDFLVVRAVEAIGLANARLLLGPPPVGYDPARLSPLESWPMAPYSPSDRDAWQALARHLADESRCVAALRGAYGGEMASLAYLLRRTDLLEGKPPSAEDVRAILDWQQNLLLSKLRATATPAWRRDWREVQAIAPPAALRRLGEAGESLLDNPRYLHSQANRVDAGRAGRRMTVVTIALRLYVGDHGRLPSTLADLVHGGYLATVPTDPFTNGPIAYAPRRGLLYCLGEDRIDQGGLSWVDCPARLDFVVTVWPSTPEQRADYPTDWAFEREMRDMLFDRVWPHHGLSTLR